MEKQKQVSTTDRKQPQPQKHTKPCISVFLTEYGILSDKHVPAFKFVPCLFKHQAQNLLYHLGSKACL